MALKTYLLPIWKWKWLILASALIATISAYFATRGLPPVFLARTTLMVGQTLNDPNPNANEFSLNQTLSSAYASLAMREPVAQAVQASLGLADLPQYKAATASNGQLIEITVTDSNPELCQAVANELARQVILQSPTGRVSDQSQRDFIVQQLEDLQRKITNTQTEIDDKTASLGELASAADIATRQSEIQALETRLSALQTNYANLLATTDQGAANSLEVFEPAALPTRPIGPNKLLIILAAAAGGLVLSTGAAYLMEFLDNTFRDADEISKVVSAPIIGYIGELERERNGALLTVAERPLSPVAEGFRSLRTNLEFMAVDHPLKTLVVTSAAAGDGKTSVALNLALMMAQSDKRVILLDADLRRPALHRALGIPNREGLSDLFRGHLDLDDVIRPWKDERLRIITTGTIPPNPTELLSSQRMDHILAGLQAKADIVIVDGPPFFVPDAWVLASKVDGALFVVRPGYTRRNAVRAAFDQFKRVNARVVGVALNRLSRPRGLYTPGTYMSYYYSIEVDQQTGEARPNGVRRRGLQSMLASFQRRPEKAAGEPAALGPGEAAPANGSGHTVRLEVLPPAPPAVLENERSRASLDVLYAISRELATQVDIRELMQHVLRMTLETLGGTSGSIIVLDERGEAMEGVMIYDNKVQMQDAAQLAEVIDRGLAGWVIKHRRPAVLDDTHADERWVQRQNGGGGGSGPRSAVSVPLMSNDRVVGVLTLSHADVGHFTRDDLSMLTAIAVGLSTNSRVYAS